MTTSGNHPTSSNSRWRVGADIGGTFTDVIAIGPDAQLVPMKVLSTPPDFGTGVINGAVAALEQAEVEPSEVGAMLHATTVATNAILEMQGARTALVTTKRFRDVLELGRLRRPVLYDLSWQKPAPLARRRHRYELDQRIHADGRIQSVDSEELAALARQLHEDGIEAVAVCLINSHLAPDVERAVAGALRESLPGVYVTASVDISPEPGEFERSSTAVVNSYVGPVVESYVSELGRTLRERGITAPFSIMQSSGGLLDAGVVVERPVQIIESGPAAGVIAVQKLAQLLELDSVVAFDMGGTTAKASLIENGQPFVANDYEVGGGMNITRSMGKGAGYTVRVPSIDIAEVGAGGGSIIGVDPAGALHVGPESASSRPGPACYGQGGDRPTLTDANVVLGYLNPAAIAGGRVTIEPELARKVLSATADRLGTEPESAARGAYEVAISSMTKAVKAVTSERGRDPRDAVMVAFGGAGPLYGAALARELGIDTVVVPVHTGLFSSLGLLVADTDYQVVTPFRDDLADVAALRETFADLTAAVTDHLHTAGDAGDIQVERILDMRYHGQRFELRIPLPDGDVDDSLLARAYELFHTEHYKTYGRSGSDDLVELVNLRVRGFVANPVTIDQALALPSDDPGERRTRTCRFDTDVATPVISRGHLSATPEPGPLVIEDMDSTTLVPPGATARIDHYNNIIISWTNTEATA
ncbi:hydantoinase/oxoprolinase family protein (plasmid) [Rhodococcus opacus]|uniref:Hydantoinase/oxoprolinase family protein n=1 Tax=Rhodococcus opacus TaxID=37919 RepID=A0ABT4NT04_RHOOP|nr:hydantoinase/oxoprolinase family protein [Rhodococcus opacus]MCZ4590523.1 hydantoinase/oxoprolinase family protein [Rhodococcus opacus]MDV7087608.1 hydantoinase/oxoprolinase family protein [Rhodococcus opacus]WKN61107.1 hydantoinase/oxoprolinase family protein [Rhodococcus opacus]